ncbi:MAG: alanine:cation symporter family protein, partial [Bacteroidales bacterium]|nr:alanine:cation symporter family protein [Bacteroidales bacterium]
MGYIDKQIINFADFLWGTPLLVLLLGGGAFFLVYSRMLPFRYLKHALLILTGRFDKKDEPGDINHWQALSTALSGTVGMGNISGVAIAITMGGPGAIFWMWMSALLGTATKFFTCTLAVMYRGRDSEGNLQGGPMYFITEGLGKKWKPLAIFFSITGMLGVFPMFQTNQLTQVIRDVLLEPSGVQVGLSSNLVTGIVITIIVSLVIFGGIKRIGSVTGKMVPGMVVVYILSVLYIIFSNYELILPSLGLIINDAFTGSAVAGGSVGAIIITGARRAAFSNEAGVGTAPMAHGAVKTNEPVREGLIAMLGPIIDTIIVCTMTALAIIITGVWKTGGDDGVTLTATAFDAAIPVYGNYLLILSVAVFSLSTMFAYPYYGNKCFSYVFGVKYSLFYKLVFVSGICV